MGRFQYSSLNPNTFLPNSFENFQNVILIIYNKNGLRSFADAGEKRVTLKTIFIFQEKLIFSLFSQRFDTIFFYILRN